MSVNSQVNKLKENWLLVSLVVVILLFSNFGTTFTTITSSTKSLGGIAYDSAMERAVPSYYPGPAYDDFAPEEEERQITKSASISAEVERGKFEEAQKQFNDIVSSSDAIILNENVQESGDESKYKTGYFSLKIETEKYDSVVSQLRAIGKETNFNENTEDITGQIVSLEDRLKLEQERLLRYQEMYQKATRVEDQIALSDRIFDQERTIKYLQDQLESQERRVTYSTVSFNMVEEQSGYAGIAIVTLSQLIKNFVSSVNSLLTLVFALIPYAVVAVIIYAAYRVIRKRK